MFKFLEIYTLYALGNLPLGDLSVIELYMCYISIRKRGEQTTRISCS